MIRLNAMFKHKNHIKLNQNTQGDMIHFFLLALESRDPIHPLDGSPRLRDPNQKDHESRIKYHNGTSSCFGKKENFCDNLIILNSIKKGDHGFNLANNAEIVDLTLAP